MSKIIIANWKMYLSPDQAILSASDLEKIIKGTSGDKEIIICPSFLSMKDVMKALQNTHVQFGAQDVFWEDRGAYTGEVSPLDLKSLKCRYVIIGHSERRKNFTEDNTMIHNKAKSCLKNGLIPVICIGEDAEQRRLNQRDYVLIQQLHEILQGIEMTINDRVIIAYEPVWAISAGGGINATPDEVRYAHQVIRHVLIDIYDQKIVDNCFRIIYGGSVDADNVQMYSEIDGVSGFLVGGASIKPLVFARLIESA